MTNALPRFGALDAMRGVAVMAILLMNIISFAFPMTAYINPRVGGGTGLGDLVCWAIMFVLVDGKMRGLFSLMFGASMLLVIEGVEAKGGDGTGAHSQRMLWLMVFGLVHAYLVWSGDILFTYAVCGLIASFLIRKTPSALIGWAIGLITANAILWAIVMGATYRLQINALIPGAPADTIKDYQGMLSAFGAPGASAIAEELRAMSGHYADVLHFRTSGDQALGPISVLVIASFETIGLFALGMALFRNGFLTGGWEPARYQAMAKRCYLLGLPPLILLAGWAWISGFDVMTTAAIVFLFSLPFKIATMLGHGALAMLMIHRFRTSRMLERIEAAGRVAFTNYLGTSVLMTTIFYGYGGGLFGHLSRWQAYLIVPIIWAIMLLWSKPWLDRFHYGPLEWLWRSLARGERQKMRRSEVDRG
jgi:uncharacterized protein